MTCTNEESAISSHLGERKEKMGASASGRLRRWRRGQREKHGSASRQEAGWEGVSASGMIREAKGKQHPRDANDKKKTFRAQIEKTVGERDGAVRNFGQGPCVTWAYNRNLPRFTRGLDFD